MRTVKKKAKAKKKMPMPKTALPWVRNQQAQVQRIWWYEEDGFKFLFNTFMNEKEAAIIFKGSYGKTNILMEGK